MTKKIIWSPLAEQDLYEITNFLFENWNAKTANQFISLVDHLVEHISKNHKLFPEINPELKVRKCVITKHNSIFYRFSSTGMEILRIFDTRQDPEKLKFR